MEVFLFWRRTGQDTYERVLHASLFVLSILMLLTPLLITDQLFFGAVTVKHYAFRILVALAFCVYVLIFIRDRQYAPKNTKTLYLLLGIFVVLLFTSVLNRTILYSFWGNSARMNGLLDFGHYLVFFLILAHSFKHFRQWHQLFQVFLFTSFISSVIAVSQWLGQPLFFDTSTVTRTSGTFGNATYLGSFLFFCLFISLFMFFDKKIKDFKVFAWLLIFSDLALVVHEFYSRWYLGEVGFLTPIVTNLYLGLILLLIHYAVLRFVFYETKYHYRGALVVVMLLQLLALFTTEATGAMLAVLVGIIAASSYYAYYKIGTKKYLVISLLIILMASAGYLAVKRFEGNLGQVLESRLLVWHAGLEAIQDRPFLGWGMNNFDVAFEKYYPQELYQERTSRTWFDKAHNGFIDIGVEGGLLAAILYLSLFIVAFRKINYWNSKHHNLPMTSVLQGLLVGYFILEIIYFDTFASWLCWFFILAFVTSRALDYSNATSRHKPILFLYNLFKQPFFFTIVLVAGTVFFIYNFSYRHVYANYQFFHMEKLLNQKPITSDDLNRLNRIIENAPSLGKFEMRNSFSRIAQVNLLTDNNLLQTDLLISAEDHLLKNIAKRPKALLPKTRLANFYYVAGFVNDDYWKKGLTVSEDIIATAPTRAEGWYFAAKFEALEGNSVASGEYYQQAISLYPEVVDPKIRYYEELLLFNPVAAQDYLENTLKPALAEYGTNYDYQLLRANNVIVD